MDDVQKLKKTMIKGSTKLIYKEDNWNEYVKKFKAVQEVAKQIGEALSDKNWGFDYPRMVREYFGGMYICLEEFYKVMKKGSYNLQVVGDQTYKNIIIPVGEIFVEMAKDIGYSDAHIELFRTRRSTTHDIPLPAEIFGYPVQNKSKEAKQVRKRHLCPFSNKDRCSKQSRLLTYPMGICSTWWPNNSPIAICPKRLLQDKTIFINAANHVFGDTDNVLLFSEVKLKRIGTFDFVLVKHKPISDEIEDFMQDKDITKNSYAFGMNTYNTIKLSFIQMLNKGQVFEVWNKKIIWAVQKYVYKNMVGRFGLQGMKLNKSDANLFFIYDIDYHPNPDKYQLTVEDIKSSTIEDLMKAFRGADLPKIDDFMKVLHQKLRLNLGIKI
ncbi:MAG: NotI family restriction endonuclease [Methanosarcinales archaeon Met12]|nr:MAG: NotI family restriction endonuclease [Methanosarcinales archaeon Met12]